MATSSGAWLKIRRKDLDLTQYDLAELVGCGEETVRKIEAGVLRPSKQLARLLAQSLGVPFDEWVAFVHFARGDVSGSTNHQGPNTPGDELAPWRSLQRRLTNVPVPLTSLIGRNEHLTAIQTALQGRVRLLTLTGPPGVGKTRLSVEAAAGVSDRFQDGVFFVSLAPVSDPRLVPAAIARALGLKETGSHPLLDTLREYLLGKRMLLLLDNFEQVVEAASVVVELLTASPWLKVLVTSREPLRVRGERQVRVEPLELPDLNHLPSPEDLLDLPSIALFVERMQEANPLFTLTEENASVVAEICARLDGIPLAIELVAAQSGLLPPSALLTGLDRVLSSSMGVLRDLPPRHQTLRNAIGWSFELLDEKEKQLFRRMAVFQGGRALEALEAVCNHDGSLKVEMLDGVTALVDKNLLQLRESRTGEPRYIMLETIHEYAKEKLQESGEAEELPREHALYFMRLAEEAEPELKGAQQAAWLDRLEDDHDNVRAALRWATSAPQEQVQEGNLDSKKRPGGEEIALRIAGAMGLFWLLRSYLSEGREHLSRALAMKAHASAAQPTESSQAVLLPPRAKALLALGTLTRQQGDFTAARSLYEESHALHFELGDKRGIANLLNDLGSVAYDQGDLVAARSLYEESLSLVRELGDERGIANALGNLGGMAKELGDYTSARALNEECLTINRKLKDNLGIAYILNNLGGLVRVQGDLVAARSLYEESLSLVRELGDTWAVGVLLVNLGTVAHLQGDLASARTLHEESLALRREIGDKLGIAISLAGLGGVAVSTGLVAPGVRVLGAVEALLEAMEAVLDSEDRVTHDLAVTLAGEELGHEEFKKAWQEGRAMSMEQAITHALEG